MFSLSLSASEKTTKPEESVEEEPPLFEIENALPPLQSREG